ncbi:hypothetical protein M514_13695 [Trichuris suis]|uniref:Uncharacterized protein n=1 Tax=Trichuris suis TaxID=68888 RepID=A0A085MYY5_9BILA|nr:hypothetical protein M514_13695 [Trichuris suis]
MMRKSPEDIQECGVHSGVPSLACILAYDTTSVAPENQCLYIFSQSTCLYFSYILPSVYKGPGGSFSFT